MPPGIIDKFQGKHRWLSNFEKAEVIMDGITYATNEHAYQSLKADNLVERLWVASSATPGVAKKRGQLVTKRSDWEGVKVSVMYEINRDKFVRHQHLRTKLLETADAELIEGNEWGDQFWGVCRDKGENHLGKIIMQVRRELHRFELY